MDSNLSVDKTNAIRSSYHNKTRLSNDHERRQEYFINGEHSQTHPQSEDYTQNYVLVWLDHDLNEFNENFCKLSTKLQQLINRINIFHDIDQCLEHISEFRKEKIILIISSVLMNDVILRIQELSVIYAQFIFYHTPFNYELLSMNEWPEVRGIFSDVNSICESIQHLVCNHNTDTVVITGQTESSFVYTVLFKETLLQIDFNDKIIASDLLGHVRKQNADTDNQEELRAIDKFLREYSGSIDNQPIQWYTRQCFMYNLVNRALNEFDVNTLLKTGFFIRDLHRNIQKLHDQQQRTDTMPFPSTVYYGHIMNEEVFRRNMQNGQLLSFNNFLSTNEDEKTVIKFIRKRLGIDTAKVGVLFNIELDPLIQSRAFARIDQFKTFAQDSKILFSTHTVFRVEHLKSIETMKTQLWEAKLRLITENTDQQFNELLQTARAEIIGTRWERMSCLLYKMGQNDKAEQVPLVLLKQVQDDHERTQLYNQIGLIKTLQGEYDVALGFYNESLKILRQTVSENDLILATPYSSIGQIYNNMGNYNKAIEFYESALNIWKTVLPENHPTLAPCYTSISEVYYELGDEAKGLEFSRKALEIQKSTSSEIEVYSPRFQMLNTSALSNTLSEAKENEPNVAKVLAGVQDITQEIIRDDSNLEQASEPIDKAPSISTEMFDTTVEMSESVHQCIIMFEGGNTCPKIIVHLVPDDDDSPLPKTQCDTVNQHNHDQSRPKNTEGDENSYDLRSNSSSDYYYDLSEFSTNYMETCNNVKEYSGEIEDIQNFAECSKDSLSEDSSQLIEIESQTSQTYKTAQLCIEHNEDKKIDELPSDNKGEYNISLVDSENSTIEESSQDTDCTAELDDDRKNLDMSNELIDDIPSEFIAFHANINDLYSNANDLKSQRSNIETDHETNRDIHASYCHDLHGSSNIGAECSSNVENNTTSTKISEHDLKKTADLNFQTYDNLVDSNTSQNDVYGNNRICSMNLSSTEKCFDMIIEEANDNEGSSNSSHKSSNHAYDDTEDSTKNAEDNIVALLVTNQASAVEHSQHDESDKATAETSEDASTSESELKNYEAVVETNRDSLTVANDNLSEPQDDLNAVPNQLTNFKIEIENTQQLLEEAAKNPVADRDSTIAFEENKDSTIDLSKTEIGSINISTMTNSFDIAESRKITAVIDNNIAEDFNETEQETLSPVINIVSTIENNSDSSEAGSNICKASDSIQLSAELTTGEEYYSVGCVTTSARDSNSSNYGSSSPEISDQIEKDVEIINHLAVREDLNFEESKKDTSVTSKVSQDENYYKLQNYLAAEHNPNLCEPNDSVSSTHNTIEHCMSDIEYYINKLEMMIDSRTDGHPGANTVLDSMPNGTKDWNGHESNREISCATLGESLCDSFTSHSSLAKKYMNMGDYEKALEYYTKDLETSKSTDASDHTSWAARLNHVGQVYNKMGDYAKALNCYEKAVEAYQKTVSESRVHLATSYCNVGYVQNISGNYFKALDYYEKGLRVYRQVLPENHRYLASAYSNMGHVYKNMGDYPTALKHYEKALKLREAALPDNHSDLALSYSSMGQNYNRMGHYKKALEYHEKALHIRMLSGNGKKYNLGTCHTNIGQVYNNLGDYRLAREHHEKALQIYLETLPANHPHLAISYCNIGQVLCNMGEFMKALDYYAKDVEITKNTLSNDHPYLAISYSNMGRVYKKMNDYNNALYYHERALDICRDKLPDNHPDLAACYGHIGQLHKKMGNITKALENYHRELQIKLMSPCQTRHGLDTLHHRLAKLYLADRQYRMAAQHIQHAVAIVAEKLPTNDPRLLYYRETLRKVQRRV